MMESKVFCHENGGSRATSQVFRFVDQTDRSQKAVNEYKTLVRSHVMTQIRRQKRSQSKLNLEADDRLTACARGYSDIKSYDADERANHSSPGRSHWALPHSPTRTFDQMMKADSISAEPVVPEQENSNERQPDRITYYSTYDMHYTSELQAIQPSDSQLGGLRYTGLKRHNSDLKTTPQQIPSSAKVVTQNANSENEVPLRGYDFELTSERIWEQDCSTSISPTILGASRVDPFRALPIPANREVYELVDNYTVAIPFLMYGTRTQKPVHHRLYDVATNDPAAFHSMLAYSARQIDSMAGSQPSKRALGHSTRTLRLIYEHLKVPSFKCGNGLVMAVALLAFAERRFGDDAIAQQHWLALREILKSRGGIERLGINRWLAAVLYWNSLVWSSNANDGNAAHIAWPSLISKNGPVTGLHATAELTNLLIDLASAKVKLLGHVHSACSGPCQYCCSRRRAVFELNGPLYKIVTATSLHEGFDDDSAAAAANMQRAASACQIPCLLYLNIVMTEYEARKELLEQFLGKLIVCIYEDSLDMDVSAEHLLIRLLSGLEDTTTELTCRAHKTIRLAAVIQSLGAKARQIIHCALLEALVYPKIDTELGASDCLLSALAESLDDLPRNCCVNDLDHCITASHYLQRADGDSQYNQT